MGRRIWLAAAVSILVILVSCYAAGAWMIHGLGAAVESEGDVARSMLAEQHTMTQSQARIVARTLSQRGLSVRVENHDDGFAVRVGGEGAVSVERIPVRPKNAVPPPDGENPMPDGGPPQGGPPQAAPPQGRPGGPPPPPHSWYVNLALAIAHVPPQRAHVEPLVIQISVDGDVLAHDLASIAIVGLLLVVVVLIAAWALASSFERAALAPLLQTTDALERLATGDFSPRTIDTRGSPQIERLARAYNAAAQQVAISFEERRRAAEEFQRFLADAGHELRTPLTIVSGYVDIIRDISALDDLTRERVVRSMRAETKRMRALVEKMLLLARMEAPVANPRTIDIDASVADVVHALRSRHPERVITMQGETASLATLDEDDLYEALFNLVENALRYAPQSDVVVETTSDAGSVRIAVVDHGPGIPAEEQAMIFERFYRGKEREQVEGSGLGLAIVKRAVERWGGSVALTSGNGETRFVLSFPRLKEAA